MTLSQANYTKIKSYVGFAIRAGKTVLGTDNILNTKKLHIVILDDTLSENAVKKIKNHCEAINCPLHIVKDTAKLLAKEGCKAFGIRDKSLAKAIIKCALDGVGT